MSNKSDRIVTGINEFDRVMGGGIVKDSISIITTSARCCYIDLMYTIEIFNIKYHWVLKILSFNIVLI